MGAITLAVALFLPHIWWLPPHAKGFFWQLFDSAPIASVVQAILRAPLLYFVFFGLPPCALTACMIWFWNLQVNWDPTIFRALLVTLEATGLALLATAVGMGVALIRPGTPGNGWGMAIALYGTQFAGEAFLGFLPCLLLTATVLARLQSKYQAS